MDNSDVKKVENQVLDGQNPVTVSGPEPKSAPAFAPASTPASTSTSNVVPASAESQKSEPAAKEATASNVQFTTANIDPKQQQYFEKIKITPDKKIKKALKDYQDYRNKPENQFHPFDEKHKKTTISIIASVVLITTATLITLALTVWKPNAENEGDKPASVANGASASEVNDSANDILHSGDDGYELSNEYYEKQISLETDESKKFDLQRDYAMFIAENGDPYSAIEYLDENVDPDNLKYKLDLRSYYAAMSQLYRMNGEEEMATRYEQRIKDNNLSDVNELLKEIK